MRLPILTERHLLIINGFCTGMRIWPNFSDIPSRHDLNQIIPSNDSIPSNGQSPWCLDLITKLLLNLLCQFRSLLVEVVVTIDLLILDELGISDVFVFSKTCP